MTSQAAIAEKRKHKRHPAKGQVSFTIQGDAPAEFDGRLLDLSVSGFRVSHAFALLCPGQQVHFRHARGTGEARVVWNRILGLKVESGFFIVSK